ncbi:MAG: hypothetical protein A2Z73_02180 [Deltaproteobacteria bacterium RBG_13_60_28]|nr:MAG: hypothetical protein A2Z73_02180 [Deltaproteobacteria bacterium RBG_13_60_28]
MATELAIALPLLLLIVAGVLDLGTLFWEKQVLTNATREGARVGARALAGQSPGSSTYGRYDKTKAQVMAIVQTYLTNFNIKNAAGLPITLTLGGNFTYNVDTSVAPNRLTIQLNGIPVNLMLLPKVQKLFPGTPAASTINLDAKTTLAAEWTTAPP